MIPKGILKRSFRTVLLCDLELLRRKARYQASVLFRCSSAMYGTQPDLLKFYNRVARMVSCIGTIFRREDNRRPARSISSILQPHRDLR